MSDDCVADLPDPLTSVTTQPRRILLTGSAGAIGRFVGPQLRRRGHFVRGYDIASPPANSCDENHQGDLLNPSSLRAALTGIDTLIHLAATSDEADFLTKLVPNNIVGPYHLLQAALECNVSRWVLASSVQVAGGLHRHSQPLAISDGTAPRNYYGCTKIMLEAMGMMHAVVHQRTVINARLGWFFRNRHEETYAARNHPAKPINVYISHDDMARFMIAAVEADLPPSTCATLWCMSRQTPPGGYDLSTAAQLIHYHPRDLYPQGLHYPE